LTAERSVTIPALATRVEKEHERTTCYIVLKEKDLSKLTAIEIEQLQLSLNGDRYQGLLSGSELYGTEQ